ncbi:hypothetical protein LI90_397 [Carbonactinospora thermoautotrophica]|uniref:Uncharacterized protein n=1 Tax=Carbonactinospora thermoautotrophica TaxID=1469144 RepID=A0A132MLR4_9ACTN|nr:hypothetical protein [Carbonactinospora thermoautotrophica]KWW98768.1 hypothetical protein LI90_397 [Carbonactinospora thermoautotrophica]
MFRKLAQWISTRLRRRHPETPVREPVTPHVIAVSGPVGRAAFARLRRQGLRLGPVGIDRAGQVLFFIAPSEARHVAHVIAWLGWRNTDGITIRHLTGPDPLRLAGDWLLRPRDAEGFLPTARTVLGTITYCAHTATLTGQRQTRPAPARPTLLRIRTMPARPFAVTHPYRAAA